MVLGDPASGSGTVPPAGPPPPLPPLPPHARLERLTSGHVLGGVATGLADHLGLPVLWVRAAFAVLAAFGGSGVALYAVFWVVLPLRPERPDDVPPPVSRWRHLQAAALLLGAVVVVVLLGVGGGVSAAAVVPLGLVAAGAALVWRQSDEAERTRWRASAAAPPGRHWRPRRVLTALAGAALLAAGLAGFLASRGELAEAREGLLATAVVVFGLGLLTAPFLTRVLADLRAERTERIRTQERAELAARLHDSVLQTLAMIQKAAEDPREVARLARGQERELRGWLYRAPPPTTASLAACLEETLGAVEETHGVPVEVVVVGDRPLDDRLRGLVAAAREAAVNAARHSGAPRVQVYAEVEPEAVRAFVRDRGRGFDAATVPPDRYGVRHSIEARMARVGGRGVVRSAPGEGTEVRLEVPLG